MFRKITSFNNRMVEATAVKLPDGIYQATMRGHTVEYRTDDEGRKMRRQPDVPIEIGVLAALVGAATHGKPIYQAKTALKDGDSMITVTVARKPAVAAIDPLSMLIDTRPNGNRSPATIK